MAKINRLVIVGPAYPLRGGIAHFNESFCESLNSLGIKASIVSFYMQYPTLFFPGKTQYESEAREVVSEIQPLLSSLNPWSWRAAARQIIVMKPEAVVIRFWLPYFGPSLGTLAKLLRKKGIKVVGLVDNAIPHEARPFDRALSQLFFKNCDAFATLSQRVADDLSGFAPGKPTHVHPHPLYDIFGDEASREESCAALGLDPNLQYILFFGFVRKYKGLDLLLDAFGDERFKSLPLKLIVAGEFYDAREPYLAQLQKHGIEERVELRDEYIPTEAVRHYFCSASIVAQPYRSATQSGVTQIAYQFGRPMLVTDVGGLAEIVAHEEVGYVVPPQPKAIADALFRFFTDAKEEAFSENVHARKHLFSWQHFTEEFLKFAEELND